MLFCSQAYLFFFVAVFTVYWLLPWHRLRVWLLLGASFYFYASWNKWLASLIVFTTAMDFLMARDMDRADKPGERKALLWLSLLMNVGLLVYFKYADFFLQPLRDALKAAGAERNIPMLNWILPIGISFYTFEAINYMVDVYRRKVPAEKNLANFMLFILFFPHLIAGPIVRARDFLPQVERRKRWDWPRLHLGAQFFLMGLFKKLAIADRMALFADPVFANPEAYGSYAVWLAAVAYALQVYCDFSGYSDMALGSAHMLGYKLVQNFDMPYLSANIAEFWRRWHMSLSTWLRDYLFFPLGGSRGSHWKTGRNLLITMTLCGLWHGANWPMVTFGFLQGWCLIVHRHFRLFCEGRPRLAGPLQSPPGTALRVAFTFLVFVATLTVFRAPSLTAGLTMLHHMAVRHEGQRPPLEPRGLWYTVAVVALCHALAYRGLWKKLVDPLPSPVRGFGYAAVLTLALVLTPDGKAFIYFVF
jgi:alginate O-acetyltransferase complex protein AlgI